MLWVIFPPDVDKISSRRFSKNIAMFLKFPREGILGVLQAVFFAEPYADKIL